MRDIGFMAQLFVEYCTINGLNLAQANIHSLHRLSLLCTEFRIIKAGRFRHVVMPVPEHPLTPLGCPFDILEFGTSFPGPSSDLLMQTGTFDFESVEYSPFIVNFGSIHPLYTNFSSLRVTIVAAAQQTTPVAARMIMYINSHLASVVWNDDPHNRLLLNAEVIMPEGYDLNALQKDLATVQNRNEVLIKWKICAKYFFQSNY